MAPSLIARTLLLVLSQCAPILARGAVSPLDSTFLRTTRCGPFVLLDSAGDSVTVYVQVGHVHFDAALKYAWPETDCSYTFLDSRENVLFRVNSRVGEGDEETAVSAVQLTVPRVGPLILLMTQVTPSAPATGLSGQLFGFDRFGNLVPFSPSITPSSNDMEESTFRPVLVKTLSGNQTESEYATDSLGVPGIETDEWSGNFTVLRLDPVWSSPGSPATFHQTRYRVRIDSSDATRWRNDYRGDLNDTLVTLFPGPERHLLRATVIRLKATSSIRFIDAVKRDEWWLHVVIDGIEGYVASPDFPKVGLPDAG